MTYVNRTQTVYKYVPNSKSEISINIRRIIPPIIVCALLCFYICPIRYNI